LFLWKTAVVQPFSPLDFSNCFIFIIYFILFLFIQLRLFSANILIMRKVLAHS